MTELNNIQFFQLRKIREKKFSNRLRRVYTDLFNQKETLEEKRQRIKLIADKINSKL